MEPNNPESKKKAGLARRLFKAVGKAGQAAGQVVGGAAETLLRSAGRTAKSAGGRAFLTFSHETESTNPTTTRELAEALTQWLVEEHQGKAALQQQKPSTVELTELDQATFYEVFLEEPGLSGRNFRFILRQAPLPEWEANFPPTQQPHHYRALLVLEWPQSLLKEPKDFGVLVWDHAAFVGERDAAVNLLQAWLVDHASGTFSHKAVAPKGLVRKTPEPVPIFGRDRELSEATELLLPPRPRAKRKKSLLSLAAPGGTGKSFFLKALKQRVGSRVAWAGVDHQGIESEESGAGLLGRFLGEMARQLEEQSVEMSRFSKELRIFRKGLESAQTGAPSGFFGHLRKAAESTAGINPVLGAVSAGVVFLTSWGQEAKEESEALAKDNAVRALTETFKADLHEYVRANSEKALCWRRPVLIFDTYEWLAPLIDTWLRTDLLADNFLETSGVVVILSGREHLLRTDTRWSEWQHQIANISLNPFNLATTREFLSSLQVEEARTESLYQLSEGLPLFLSLAAQIKETDEAVRVLAERVLEEVPKEHWLEFQKASLLEHFEPNSLQKLFAEQVTPELVELLNNATFTLSHDGKRSFLPPVKRVFERSLLLQLGEPAVHELKARLS
ncbi:MAG: hypothetical protein WC314_25805 [Vulcanimicrobiota bacterium]